MAVARQVAMRHPKLKICVLEKEKELATHQSHRNSGVVHCGIYYKKNSLKSKFCIKGAGLIKDYCKERGLPYSQCGKMIVATRQDELKTLHDLYSNAKSNNIEGIELVNKSRIQEIQPGCSNAIEAIWSPNTAIVDWRQIALSYADDFRQMNGTIMTDFVAYDFKQGKKFTTLIEDIKTGHTVETKTLVCCAGVYSDYFARRTGNVGPGVVPFKGNYFLLSDRLAKTIKTNVYPVPNPKMPFLGVHITPRIDGSVLVGPTSLLTLGYERYNDGSGNYNLHHTINILFRTGLINMLRKKEYLKAGLLELYKFVSVERLTREVQQLLPDVKVDDLIKTKFCGIRAQVISRDGQLIDDFLIESGLYPSFSKVLHLRNCPSPAATSSLAIAERVVNILEERMIQLK